VPFSRHLRYARAAGKQILQLVADDITPDRILTREAFENALIIHAATGGSTNALLHLPAIAGEAGIELTIDDFDRVHRTVPVLANAKTTGKYPVEYLWYAGGVPAIMLELRDLLHLDCLTVTGKTLGQNLDEIEQSGFFVETQGYLRNVHVEREEVLRPRADPFGPEGGIAVLRGNLAPRGAVVKYFSVPDEMHVHTGPARVFDSEDTAVEALLARRIGPGDIVVIRYEGPRANGMPEMYFATAIIASDPALSSTTAVVTDGRFSGAAKGPAIGHVTPEALDGGPIALVEEGDLLSIDIPNRSLAIVGIAGRRLPVDEVGDLLERRRLTWRPTAPRRKAGILSLYSRVASGSDRGALLT
jgi:dihydroxy-acid dehydratase